MQDHALLDEVGADYFTNGNTQRLNYAAVLTAKTCGRLRTHLDSGMTTSYQILTMRNSHYYR